MSRIADDFTEIGKRAELNKKLDRAVAGLGCEGEALVEVARILTGSFYRGSRTDDEVREAIRVKIRELSSFGEVLVSVPEGTRELAGTDELVRRWITDFMYWHASHML